MSLLLDLWTIVAVSAGVVFNAWADQHPHSLSA